MFWVLVLILFYVCLFFVFFVVCCVYTFCDCFLVLFVFCIFFVFIIFFRIISYWLFIFHNHTQWSHLLASKKWSPLSTITSSNWSLPHNLCKESWPCLSGWADMTQGYQLLRPRFSTATLTLSAPRRVQNCFEESSWCRLWLNLLMRSERCVLHINHK